MTYTPGPWTENGREIWPANGKAKDSVLASCYQVPPYDAEANARLIAAAPALVEALEAMLKDASQGSVWDVSENIPETLLVGITEKSARMAHAALTLAKGE